MSILLQKPLRLATVLFLGVTGLLPICKYDLYAQALVVTCPPSDTLLVDQFSCSATAFYDVTYTSSATLTDSFTTAGYYSWQVPPGVTEVFVEVWGAQGNSNAMGVPGGLGGFVSGNLAVTPSTLLELFVGQGGIIQPYGGYSGYAYGGDAGFNSCNTAIGGGGGAGSEILRISPQWNYERLVVAGGGGGAGGNRINGCGRGTGGGGGGGYYGGGGGAGWPSSSNVLPTGGNQSTGGTGGVSNYSGAAPYNNGYDGGWGYGGYGGEEVNSSQGGSQAGLQGGDGGAIAGEGGAYSCCFIGQSGAGGSNFVDSLTSPVTNTRGVQSGEGKIRITYPDQVTLNYISGHDATVPFDLGTTVNTVVGSQLLGSDTCSFSITVMETEPPFVFCPFQNTLFLDAQCNAIIPDYTSQASYFDNCDPSPVLSQLPAAGSVLSGLLSETVWIIATDQFNNSDSCTFILDKIDGSPPVVLQCPNVIYNLDTVADCSPQVFFPDPTFGDNCPGNLTIISTDSSGSKFLVGTTTVTFTATDAAGYSVDCSFEVFVSFPRINNIINVSYSGPCEGDTVTLTAPTGYLGYLWSNNTTSNVAKVTLDGTYWVRIANGPCNARDSVDVSLLAAPNPQIVQSGPLLCTSTSFVSYQWYRGPLATVPNTAIPGAVNQCYQPTQNLPHRVRVEGANGCFASSTTTIAVAMDGSMGLLGFELYPNPAQDELNISLSQPLTESGDIRVVDMAGRIVIQQNFDQLQGIQSLNLAELSSGTYMVEIRSGAQFGRRRVAHVR